MRTRIGALRAVATMAFALAAGLSVHAARTGGFDAPALRPPGRDTAATPPVPGADGSPTVVPAATDSVLHGGVPTLPAGATPQAAAGATPTVDPRRVGLIPGHWRFDSGAVCADGLREVDVTVDVALRARALLEARGYAVDLLPEHDPDTPQPPLQGYRAAALVSIHADSCSVPGASGFKVARWPYSATADADDRLVACLNARYAAATLLPRHDDSITIDMWNYYAFREVGADTPAAIIELAFLLGDRAFVDAHRYEMALGIADGITCLLEGAAPD